MFNILNVLHVLSGYIIENIYYIISEEIFAKRLFLQ